MSKESTMRDIKSEFRVLVFSLGTALVASVAVPGCGTQADELCDIQCECERCSDRRWDECGIDANAQADQAAIYGCQAEYDEFIECAIDDNDCDDNSFSIDDSCDNEREDFAECIADNSDINSGSGSGSGSGQQTVNCDCSCECQASTVPAQGPCDPNTTTCTCDAGCELLCGQLGGLVSASGTCG